VCVLTLGSRAPRGSARWPVACLQRELTLLGVRSGCAKKLHGVRDDVNALAALAVWGLPLAPFQASVDRDGAALGEVIRAVLALGSPYSDVEVVGAILVALTVAALAA
jgi:hypothetical protein